jgi:hypothetical protein
MFFFPCRPFSRRLVFLVREIPPAWDWDEVT